MALRPRDVDAGIDPDRDVAELHLPDDPGQRLPREAAFDDGAEESGVPGGMREEVVRLVLGRDEPGFGEARHQGGSVGCWRHVGYWSTLHGET